MITTYDGTQTISQVNTTAGTVAYPNVTYTDFTFGNYTSTMTSWCSGCSGWYYGYHNCHHSYLSAHEHNFQQARAPHADTLFCSGCGETKRLKAAKTP